MDYTNRSQGRQKLGAFDLLLLYETTHIDPIEVKCMASGRYTDYHRGVMCFVPHRSFI